ncbi:MAG TPA: type II toxin-antitoxin system prevent-host-death family antitoxin [Fimbriiglobus sp.]|nr:type II toxin-antitoxin system prevent-host-death family antitoxin [Fimbriiglobus sp.]
MNAVTTDELIARLKDYLSRTARGEEFLVTDLGKPVARIVPPAGTDVRQVVRDMLAYRDQQKRTLGGVTVQELRDEGRRS